MSYINLINYTNYSTGVITPEELVNHPDSLNFKYAAITDYGTLGGVPHFVKLCKEKGIKPIIGITLTINVNNEKGNIVFLAQNQKGYEEIIQLNNIQNNKGEISINDINENIQKNTYSIIGQSGSIIRRSGNVEETLKIIKEKLGRKLLLGVEAGKNKEFYKNIYKLGKEENLGVILVNNNRAINKQTSNLIVEKIKNHKMYNDSIIKEHEIDIANNYFKSEKYFLTEAKISETFLERNFKVAKSINDIEIFNDVLITKSKQNTNIEELAIKNLEKFLEDNNIANKEKYRERLKEELNIIKETGYKDYFDIIYEIGNFAKENNIAYGSRGSAVGSLVLFSLGLSHVDPIRHNLLFERFLNAERKELPDIDLELGNQKPVIDYITKIYGKENISSILSYTTMKKGKQSLLFVKNALINELKNENSKKNLEQTYNDIIAAGEKGGKYKGHSLLDEPLSEVLEENNKISQMFKSDRNYRYLLNLSLKAEGQIFNKTKKKDSFIIANKPINKYGSYIEDENGLKFLEASGKEYIQDLGLIKYDLLPTNNLDLTLKLYNYLNINDLDFYKEAKYKDEETFKMISAGFTTSLNQLKAIGQELCKSIKPQNIDELIAIMALVRLTKENKDEYINAKNNKEKRNTSTIKEYNEILNETYGVILYEEQIMLIAQKVGGLSKFQSDEIRSAIKKNKPEKILEYKNDFIQNSINKGNQEEESERIFNELYLKCGKYHFNKSHATAYASVCYKQAYAKRHFPAEFLEFFGDKQTKAKKETTEELLREFYKMGYRIASPDINRNEKQKRTIVIQNNHEEIESIDYGLSDYINDNKMVNSIIEERERGGYFKDIFDFIERTYPKYINENSILSVNAKNNPEEQNYISNLEQLAELGFFDDIYNIKTENIINFRNGMKLKMKEVFKLSTDINASKELSIETNNNNIDEIFQKEEERFGISHTKLRVNKM